MPRPLFTRSFSDDHGLTASQLDIFCCAFVTESNLKETAGPPCLSSESRPFDLSRHGKEDEHFLRLDLTEFSVALEEQLDIELEDDEVAALLTKETTLDDWLKLVGSKLQKTTPV